MILFLFYFLTTLVNATAMYEHDMDPIIFQDTPFRNKEVPTYDDPRLLRIDIEDDGTGLVLSSCPTLSGNAIDRLFTVQNKTATRFYLREEVSARLKIAQEILSQHTDLTIYLVEGYGIHHPGRMCGAMATLIPVNKGWLGNYAYSITAALGLSYTRDETWNTSYISPNEAIQKMRCAFIDALESVEFVNVGQIHLWTFGDRYHALLKGLKTARYGEC